jgi:hypothetical protein
MDTSTSARRTHLLLSDLRLLLGYPAAGLHRLLYPNFLLLHPLCRILPALLSGPYKIPGSLVIAA